MMYNIYKLALVCSPESSPELRRRNTASISSITITCKADLAISPLHADNSASASENNPLTSFSDPLVVLCVMWKKKKGIKKTRSSKDIVRIV